MSRYERSGSFIGPRVRFGTLIDCSNCEIKAHASRSWLGRSSTVLRSWSRSSCFMIASGIGSQPPSRSWSRSSTALRSWGRLP
jgi:hypothetical protein